MPFFLNKQTTHEFITYLKTLPLEELLQINRRYEAHFIELFDKLDRVNEELSSLDQKLSLEKQKIQTLKLTEASVTADEELRLEQIKSLDSSSSRSERFLLITQLKSFSPLAHYNSSIMTRENTIRSLNNAITLNKNKLMSIRQDIDLSKKELNIINKIRNEFKEVETQQQDTTKKPHGGLTAI